MGIDTLCFTPEVAFRAVGFANEEKAIIGSLNGLMGEFAERLIEFEYLKWAGGGVLTNHYFDNPIPLVWLLFLVSHNPEWLVPERLYSLILHLDLEDSDNNRPDICTDMDLSKEYYEIKPASESGKREGLKKLRPIGAMMSVCNFPYEPGVRFDPG